MHRVPTHARHTHVHAHACMDVPSHARHTPYMHMYRCVCTNVHIHARSMHIHSYAGAHARTCSYTHATRLYTYLCTYACMGAPLHTQHTPTFSRTRCASTGVLIGARYTHTRTPMQMYVHACTPTRTSHAKSRTEP